MQRKRDAVVARCYLWTGAKVVKSAAQLRATVFDDRSYTSKDTDELAIPLTSTVQEFSYRNLNGI